MTNLRLFQTEKSLQITISNLMKMAESSLKVRFTILNLMKMADSSLNR